MAKVKNQSASIEQAKNGYIVRLSKTVEKEAQIREERMYPTMEYQSEEMIAKDLDEAKSFVTDFLSEGDGSE